MIVSITGKPLTQRTPEEVLAERQRFEKMSAQMNESEMISRSRPEPIEALVEDDQVHPGPYPAPPQVSQVRTMQMPPGYDPELIKKNTEIINAAQAALLEAQTVRAEEVLFLLLFTFWPPSVISWDQIQEFKKTREALDQKDKEIEMLRKAMSDQTKMLSEMKKQMEKPAQEDAEKTELLKANQQYETALKTMQDNMKILQKNQAALQENLRAQQELNKKKQKSSSCSIF
jgi:hypothetical protein